MSLLNFKETASEKSRLPNFLQRRPRRQMPDRAREDADGSRRRDDAAMRSVSGAAPCGRKESGDDGRRVGRCGRRDCRGGCGSAGIAESAGKAAKQDVTRRLWTTWGLQYDVELWFLPRFDQFYLNATPVKLEPGTKAWTEDCRASTSPCKEWRLLIAGGFCRHEYRCLAR